MTLSITAQDYDGQDAGQNYDNNPDTCPVCHTHIAPKRYTAAFTEVGYLDYRLQILFRCTRRNCDSFFFGIYTQGAQQREFELVKLTPKSPREELFSETIKEVSPTFVQIYNEAVAAESLELSEIAGIGYRKALEFLIKDFAIQQKPSDEEKIKTTFLGTVIKDYIDDSRLKSTVTRATWLGNDETHYVRKWIDKDINDLKLLIKLSINWIENVLLTDKYSTEMS
jgi:hypothetical protein